MLKLWNVDFIVQRTNASSKCNLCHYESNELNAHEGIFCSNTKSSEIALTYNNCSVGECAQIRVKPAKHFDQSKSDIVPY